MHQSPRTSAAGSFVLERARPDVSPPVELTTIDRIVAELNLTRVDFIKMDIEGAEARALSGARDVVSRFRPRLAIGMEHHADDAEVLPALVKRLWPDAEVACSPCTFVSTPYFRRIQPVALWVKFAKSQTRSPIGCRNGGTGKRSSKETC